MSYDLYYWPFIPGRGEFVRLLLEATGTPYRDVARLPEPEGGPGAVLRVLREEGAGLPAFAPPMLKHEGLTIAQTPLILRYLGPRVGMCPADEGGRLAVDQLQLTVGDFLVEVHDVHHPIGSGLYYEEQKAEASRRAQVFRRDRLPKFLGYFERALARNGGGQTVGRELSYADLSLFQMLAGVDHAFPRAFGRLRPTIPLLLALAERVKALPAVAAYLASPRRLAFNDHGIFRHYPELDET